MKNTRHWSYKSRVRQFLLNRYFIARAVIREFTMAFVDVITEIYTENKKRTTNAFIRVVASRPEQSHKKQAN
jgi:hypothetical protein